jgi:hypothetical protein
MKDTRMYLVIEDEQGKRLIPAVTKLGNTNLVASDSRNPRLLLPVSYEQKDESLVYWVTLFENELAKSIPKGLMNIKYPVGLASQVIDQNTNNYKLISDPNVEILPDFSYQGLLLFPVPVSYDSPKIMLYDLITKTDDAGNILNKTTFEIPLKKQTSNYWYDANIKRWERGTPPQTR